MASAPLFPSDNDHSIPSPPRGINEPVIVRFSAGIVEGMLGFQPLNLCCSLVGVVGGVTFAPYS